MRWRTAWLAKIFGNIAVIASTTGRSMGQRQALEAASVRRASDK
jgi:hypothetical protein